METGPCDQYVQDACKGSRRRSIAETNMTLLNTDIGNRWKHTCFPVAFIDVSGGKIIANPELSGCQAKTLDSFPTPENSGMVPEHHPLVKGKLMFKAFIFGFRIRPWSFLGGQVGMQFFVGFLAPTLR